ncbi:unnamed protein product [Prorocentrum cordatum]|uniref:Uncharacterized protein n=1 Tax=Prorocentrum cordatum TaxID=2364126 RepID=A0ABN9U5L0_9DINO|nr:unnamed protein product [Polarella glacialis]
MRGYQSITCATPCSARYVALHAAAFSICATITRSADIRVTTGTCELQECGSIGYPDVFMMQTRMEVSDEVQHHAGHGRRPRRSGQLTPPAMPPSNGTARTPPWAMMPPSDGMPAAMMPPSDGMPAAMMPPSDGMPAAMMPPSDGMPAAMMPPSGSMPAAMMPPSVMLPPSGMDGAAMPSGDMPPAEAAPSVGGAAAAAAPGVLSATGDPHLVNVHGEHFDVMRPGVHVLLLVPFRANRSDALLAVEADARRVGDACADTYFMSVNMTGAWVESKVASLGLKGGHGLFFSAGTKAAGTGTPWMSFGAVWLKVRHGRTSTGTAYLNFFARNLRHAGHIVGGLLGEDDHTEVAALSSGCKKTLAL